jgi:hypothetical protein
MATMMTVAALLCLKTNEQASDITIQLLRMLLNHLPRNVAKDLRGRATDLPRAYHDKNAVVPYRRDISKLPDFVPRVADGTYEVPGLAPRDARHPGDM